MNKLLFLSLFFIVSLGVFAQAPVVIKGVIKDAKTGERLIGATVSVKGTGIGTATDFEGEFTLKLSQTLPETQTLPVTLVASYAGYSSMELVVSSVAKPVDFKLSENVQQLKDVEIRDSRVTEKQKQAPLTVETMDAIAIKETPAANFYEGLSHLKGVDLTSASIGFKIINTRGFNSTSPVRSLQLIDGVDNQSPGLNFSLGNFLGASELDVQRVDLVVGASGAYYGPNAFNGVINMVTKSPFQYPGLSASVKVGERSLFEGAVRFAQVFKNKKGEDKFAYKLNIFHMQAYDWEATNTKATSQSRVDALNPGGYDAVNTYGDEYTNASFTQSGVVYIGYGTIARNGYQEKDLVDYNSNNTKLGAAFHYKFHKDNEIIYSTSYGTGTTVYQGDNRFSLRDIQFFQNRLEVRKEGKYFVRAYATNENAGNSYDAYSTGLKLQEYSKKDADWGKDYAEFWNKYIFNRMNKIRQAEIPPGSQPPGTSYTVYANQYMYNHYYDSLVLWHQMISDSANQRSVNLQKGVPRYEPGTERFDSAFNAIRSTSNQRGGSKFIDKSALYHIAAEYKFKFITLDFTIGGNYRMYRPHSEGTIFIDSAAQITNQEFGAYFGLERKIGEHVKVSATNRIDKNQNFNLLWSPAATAVFTVKKNVFRMSVSSAIRNPTLTDQYYYLDVGPAILIGNLHGFDSLVTTESLLTALSNGKDKLQYFNVEKVKPERVQTIEFGYRGSVYNDKLYFDLSYYYSRYEDFLGYKIGAKVDWPYGTPYLNDYQVYRVTTNSKDIVTTQGFTIGLNYFMKKYLGFVANYSWNKIDRGGSTDPVIPAYNTPEHKYNLGVNGRDIDTRIGDFAFRHWGYSINYKYQTGFSYEGSPQFTGYVNAYDMVDVQVNKKVPVWRCTFKLGASNALNNKVYQVYGGPQVGRLAYASVLFELDKWK
jgi:iron complex outermembrane receptor protein